MATLTVKNISQETYTRLKGRAQANHRSLNQEVIAIIERSLDVPPIDVDLTLERTRQIRELTAQYNLKDEELEQWKNEGRE